MHVTRSRPPSRQGSADRYTGAVWIDPIADALPPGRLRAASARFAPGARSAWHMHPLGQILHVTEGVGRVQARGGSMEEIRAGDTVVTGAAEWHWHGAAPEHFMTHLAFAERDENGEDVSFGALVTDEEYAAG